MRCPGSTGSTGSGRRRRPRGSFATGTRRARRRSCCSSEGSSRTTSTRTCCASSSLELLGLEEWRELELGKGTSRAALAAYVEGIAAVLANVGGSLRRGAPVVVVINDRRDLYPEILERAGLRLEERYRRHVNRRTGRRAGELFEDVVVARAEAGPKSHIR